jgi:carboxyl-terminal processing protease
MNKNSTYSPIVFALVLIAGILLGDIFLKDNSISQNPNKLDLLLDQLDEIYVDSIDKDELTEQAVQYLLEELDPHSSYIPAKDLAAINEPMEGSFDGIGIEFNLQKDTILVVAPISGGPSQMVGIQSGDKIVTVNGDTIAGTGLTNDAVFKLLRGKKGTKVKLGILRNNQIIDFELSRDKIPIYSVDVSYMVNSSTGYIKINRFSATTYQEFRDASKKLLKLGMKELILDLRNNPGGYLGAAINVSNEFLKREKLIVFTKGREGVDSEHYSNDDGMLIETKVVVVINEGSASASEIVAGAIQDNDRGTIVGRRSFGKGLVQEQFQNKDGSAYRITTQRYYTPTGRCIQRPYINGEKENYNEEILGRYENGELLSEDSIPIVDSLQYITPLGKVVYGGGGIAPDVFVAIDTVNFHDDISAINRMGLIRDFTFEYSNEDKIKIKSMGLKKFITDFEIDEKTLLQLKAFCKKQDQKLSVNEFNNYDLQVINTQLKAQIGRGIWNDEAFFPVIHEIDNTFQRALKE